MQILQGKERIIAMFNTRFNFDWSVKGKMAVIIAKTIIKGKRRKKLLVNFSVLDKEEKSRLEIRYTVSHNSVMTGKGDAFAITSAVLQAMKEFHESKYEKLIGQPSDNIKMLYFTADATRTHEDQSDSGRVDLYKRMVKKFAPLYGYSVKIAELPVGAHFILKR